MFAITGITGRVGGIVARTLLTAKEPVRAVVRDAGKGAPWLERGCELALAEMNDAAALTAAFEAAEGIFVLPPPIFDPEPGFPEARATANAVRSALEATHPSKVVCISTIGAQATRPNLLTQLRLMEQALGGLGDTHYLSAPGLVYGERRLGCSFGSQHWRDFEFSAAARQAIPDGCHCGRRADGG